MKTVLYEKLHGEGCCFKKSDISIRKIPGGYKITIKDYEHIPFRVTIDHDACIGAYIAVERMDDDSTVMFTDGTDDRHMKEAMLNLGYYIASRF